ncbi:hypothetical protein FXF51_50775 [Nonomuraea sp. PA05]|uniref:hypothetical protein n=1 Tax=Nonomuraea sp. PA05 TaxID=2604466 RepID=UPI0011D4BCB7|nr:hypothetical protein [Nonomuraea sp. PA05]TYB52760.1 hypothetical protein FXF51_50775 [Nonomuraea sp. PA05]
MERPVAGVADLYVHSVTLAWPLVGVAVILKPLVVFTVPGVIVTVPLAGAVTVASAVAGDGVKAVPPAVILLV